ncbi:hypothetical protein HK100_007615 [Physocladia obscura]|uniref:Zn(2)-C6 fungal-type domain-containing protein n=1 Tax=Physocladia obscura TaxID=109957 RepID=A0AAD5T9L1_9FUNG|nr:hypothetical protein HK100_007615 [Physocladia obscura]
MSTESVPLNSNTTNTAATITAAGIVSLHPFPDRCLTNNVRLKSCEACRLKNKKCSRDPVCERCAEKGVQCVYSMNSTRNKEYKKLKLQEKALTSGSGSNGALSRRKYGQQQHLKLPSASVVHRAAIISKTISPSTSPPTVLETNAVNPHSALVYSAAVPASTSLPQAVPTAMISNIRQHNVKTSSLHNSPLFDFVGGGSAHVNSIPDINSDLMNFLSAPSSMSPQFPSSQNGPAPSLYSFQQKQPQYQQQQQQRQSSLHLAGGFSVISSPVISTTTAHPVTFPHIQQQQSYVFDSVPVLPSGSMQSPFSQQFVPQEQQNHQFISLQQQREQQPEEHPHLFAQFSQQLCHQNPSIQPTNQQQKWINIDSLYNPTSPFTVPSQSSLTMPSPPFSCILPPNASLATGFNIQAIALSTTSGLVETPVTATSPFKNGSSNSGSPSFSIARGEYDEDNCDDMLVRVVQQQQMQHGSIGGDAAMMLTGVSFTAADLSRGNVADILKLGSQVGFGGSGDENDFQAFLEEKKKEWDL